MTEDSPLRDEAKLVRAAKAGDPNAFGLLYDAYVDRLYRFVYYRVSDEPLAEDLTSRVFLKAWENLQGYRDRGLSFGAWLFSIARNTVIDHYRTIKQEQSLETAGPLVDEEDPESLLRRTQQGDQLANALRQLTDDQREVLVLKFIEGYDTNEIAGFVGKKPGAVRALQMRGLQALERILGGEEPW
ncbi:MAG: sigma-70 family RNA polymerase sigma factor [Anaerolineae bacterium]|nr:MAG: sigma-70 family RNA polymerase sigma factor [Anaerolineae bacterium]